jgi:para-nitrobenzyl esterase
MIKLMRISLFSTLLFSLSLSSVAQLSTVQTDAGKVEGYRGANGIGIFKGIPFAAPPVGDLRWKAPQPVKPWEGVKKCTAFGPSPMQGDPLPFSMWTAEFLIPREPIGEDCLYLNVWSGARSSNEKRPVMVWIYGGGFSSGGAACPIYDGEAMAAKGIVFVSINYRVGIFGFFAHPELTREAGSSGNYGLMDQIAALEWVKRNIASFGGDPSNVTIAGQSAGSFSVNCLVASPLAKGLFNKAIAQSGASFVSDRLNTSLKDAEENGRALATKMGVKSLAELRTIPASDLLKKANWMSVPIIDGKLMTAGIDDVFKNHRENDVVLLTGWNQDEGLLFGPVRNAVDFKKQMTVRFGAHADKLLEYYPAKDDGQAAQSQQDLSRDEIFGVQQYVWASIQSSRNKKVYVYRFTRKVPARGEYVKYGAFHTGEVPYAYNNLKFVDRPWETQDQELAELMSDYWVNFIRSGDPNGRGLPNWPAFDGQHKKIMLLGTEKKAVTMPDAGALEVLAEALRAK